MSVVAVTGASGHLGGHLVRALAAEGHHVRAVVVEPEGSPIPALDHLHGLDVTLVRADVRDAGAVRSAVDGAELVCHLAAHISIVGWDRRLVEAVNVGGTRNVVDACVVTGVTRLVHVSSIHACLPNPAGGPIGGGPPTADLIDTSFPYDRSKAVGERVVMDAVADGLESVILRPTAFIGPGDHRPSFVGKVLLDVWNGRLPAVVPGGFNWVDVRDVAAAAVAATRRGVPGRRYLVSGHSNSIADLTASAAALVGRRPRPVLPMAFAHAVVPFAGAWGRVRRRSPLFTRSSLLALTHYNTIDGSLAAQDLGHVARPFDATLADTLEWFADQGVVRRARGAWAPEARRPART